MSIREALNPEASPRDPTERLPVVLLSLLVGLAVVLYWVPLRGVNPRNVGGYGLIEVLPKTTLLGAALLVIAFVATLSLKRPAPILLGAQIVVLVVSLHTLAQVMEPIARFPTVWQHAGFIEYITRTGGIAPDLEARFNWAAFFAMIGFITKAVGVSNIEPVLHWTPLVMQLLYLLPLAMIVRVMRANWRAKWFAVWLFPVANWVGQDYLAPQAFGFLLYLIFLAILLTWFRPKILHTRTIGARRTDEPVKRPIYDFIFGPKLPGEEPVMQVGSWERSLLVVLLVVILLVGTAAHQLTPYLLIASAAGLILVRRCELRGLPIIGGVIYLAWISFMAYSYWKVSPQQTLFAGSGNPINTILQSTSGRVLQGADPGIQAIQNLRIYLVLVVVALTVIGLIRRRSRGIDDRVALILLVVPISSFGLQSYGGEIALRTYFFMLPGAVFLAAYAFFPDPKPIPVVKAGPWRLRFRRFLPSVVAASFALALLGGFLVVRYGNEAFEQTRPNELSAFDAMLKDAKGPVTVVWASGELLDLKGNPDAMQAASQNPQGPWGYRYFERFQFRNLLFDQDEKYFTADRPVLATRKPTVDQIAAAMGEPNSYFYTSKVNEVYQTLNFGLATNWGATMRQSLDASPLFKRVYAGPDAAVYKLATPPEGPAPVQPAPGSLTIGISPWTPAGLIYLPVLLGVLTLRELKRIRLEPGEYRRLRPYSVLAFPLLIGLIAIVVERFMYLGGSG